MYNEITVNVSTNEITERKFTKEEIAQIEAAVAQADAKRAELEAEAAAKEAARAALLDRLGISADEAQLLLGSN